MAIIFSVEGNIGSGKSTLVKCLSKCLPKSLRNHEIIFLQEPVDVWNTIKDENGVTILEKFYADQSKYAFSFQMMAYISRLSILKREIEKKQNVIIICERSVWTDRNVFAKMLYDDKKIEMVNYDIYNRWFDEFVKKYPLNGIIYVKTDPDICQKRIGIRSREGETIPLEYSVKCHNYHEKWINNSSCDTLILDGNNEFIGKLPDDWESKIISFMEKKAPPLPEYNNTDWIEMVAC